jgi:acetyltransferase-like isoleucine patch superfamily enzyme
MKFWKIISVLFEFNLRTIYFNFKYLPFHQAIYMPVFISRHVYLADMKGNVSLLGQISTRQIRIGYKAVGIFDHKRSRSIWDVRGNVTFKGEAFIGHGCKISINTNASVVFGDKFAMTAESSIACSNNIEFGDGCLVSWETLIMDTDFHKIFDENMQQINESRPIFFGDRSWIGCRCLILKGAKIPTGSIIAANTTVGSRPIIGENRIFGGNPVSELRKNIIWTR